MIRRRRRLGLTDYNNRKTLLKGGLPRVVVRKSNRGIRMQICEYAENGDVVKASASSNELKRLGWLPKRNTPTAYLTGMALAGKAEKLKIGECILDIGLHKPAEASVLFAAAKGAIDNGLDIRGNIDFDSNRISGAHIKGYSELLAKDKKETSIFSSYAKGGISVPNITGLFNDVKSKLIGNNKK